MSRLRLRFACMRVVCGSKFTTWVFAWGRWSICYQKRSCSRTIHGPNGPKRLNLRLLKVAMPMRSLLLGFLLCLIASQDVHAADSATSTVRFQWGSDQKLVVTYQWPTACVVGLQFASGDPRTNALNAKGAEVNTTSDTSVLRLEVPLSTESGEHHYPWAHPVGNGVYIYLPYYAIKDNCGAVQTILDAPGVMFLNGIEPGPIIAKVSSAEASTAVLFQSAPAPHKKQSIYADPVVGQAFASELEDLFLQGLTFYQAALPKSSYRPSGLVIGVTQDRSQIFGFGGDATNVIRLHYYNLPTPLAPAMRKKIKLTLLHELAHRFHPESIGSSALYPLPSEGGADFLRWSAAYSLGLIDKAEAAELFDAALANCLKQTGATPWMQLDKRARFSNRVPYDCGFVAYALGLSMRQGAGTALGRVDALFAMHAKQQKFDFSQAMECSDTPACEAQWLPRMFGQRETITQVIDDWAAQTGIVVRVAEDTAAHAPSQFPICPPAPLPLAESAVTAQSPAAPACKPIPEPVLKLLHRVNLDLLRARFTAFGAQ